MLIRFYRLPKKCITGSYKLWKQWYVMRFRWQTRSRQQQAKSDKFNLCFNFAVMDRTCGRAVSPSSRRSGRLSRWQHTGQHYICHLWGACGEVPTSIQTGLFFFLEEWSQGRAQGSEEAEQTALTEKSNLRYFMRDGCTHWKVLWEPHTWWQKVTGFTDLFLQCVVCNDIINRSSTKSQNPDSQKLKPYEAKNDF